MIARLEVRWQSSPEAHRHRHLEESSFLCPLFLQPRSSRLLITLLITLPAQRVHRLIERIRDTVIDVRPCRDATAYHLDHLVQYTKSVPSSAQPLSYSSCMFLINHRQLFARNACIFTYSSPSGQDENMHAGCAQLYPTWSSIRILPASPSPAVPDCGWMGFVPPRGHLDPRFGVCVSARLVRPCVSGRKHEGRGFPSSTPSKAFPLLQTRPAASAFLSRDSKWRKLEERLHGSLTANRSTARRPKILYAIEADLLVAYAGVRPVVRRVTWLRISPNSLSGKSSTSIIHNKSRPSPTDH